MRYMSIDLKNKINTIYTHLELICSEIAVLKKELSDRDVLDRSGRDVIISDQEKQKILQTRQKKKLNQSFKKGTK